MGGTNFVPTFRYELRTRSPFRGGCLLFFTVNLSLGGSPAFNDLCVRVPRPCVFCKGGRRCRVCYLFLLWTRDQTHLAPAFPTPALRKKREGTCTHCVGNARKTKSLGHPRYDLHTMEEAWRSTIHWMHLAS